MCGADHQSSISHTNHVGKSSRLVMHQSCIPTLFRLTMVLYTAQNPGAYHEATIGEHGRNAPVPEGIEGTARADTAAGHHVPGCAGRARRRRRQ